MCQGCVKVLPSHRLQFEILGRVRSRGAIPIVWSTESCGSGSGSGALRGQSSAQEVLCSRMFSWQPSDCPACEA